MASAGVKRKGGENNGVTSACRRSHQLCHQQAKMANISEKSGKINGGSSKAKRHQLAWRRGVEIWRRKA